MSGSLFNQKRSKVSVLPFTSLKTSDNSISPAIVKVCSSEKSFIK
ncbi:hypothetical protein [Xenococcus sp. PCC 7305]